MNRELDVKIAKAKGLDVVGELQAYCHNDRWNFYPDVCDDSLEIQPVYVLHCQCLENDCQDKYFNHSLSCFDVVPFWSSDLNKAFELVDEIKLLDMVESVDIYCMRDETLCVIDYLGSFSGFYTGRDYIKASGETKQEAICRAYLEWHDLTHN